MGTTPETIDLAEAKKRLAAADSREAIADAALRFARTHFKRTALFNVMRGVMVGWDGRGEGMKGQTIRSMMVPLEEPSVFKLVSEIGSHLLGGFVFADGQIDEL